MTVPYDSHINEQLPPITGFTGLIDMLLSICARMWGIAYDDDVSGEACAGHVCAETQQSLMKRVNDCGALGVSNDRRKERDARG
jgi:hypothetical protein